MTDERAGVLQPGVGRAVRDALNAGPAEAVRADKLQEYWDLFDFIKSVYPASWALGCRELPAELGGGPAYLNVSWAGGSVTDCRIIGPDEPLAATYVLAMDYTDWKALHEGYDAQRTVMYRKILLEDGNLLEFFKAHLLLRRVPGPDRRDPGRLPGPGHGLTQSSSHGPWADVPGRARRRVGRAGSSDRDKCPSGESRGGLA